MPYTLHIANKRYSSWSMRPWVLMKALDLPFVEAMHEFGAGHRQPAFQAFSPSGQVPTLEDGDLVVWDSLAIAEYLHETTGVRSDRSDAAAVWPASREARAWARCAAAEMHAGFAALRDRCGFCVALRIELSAADRADEELRRDIGRVDALWREGLARFGGPWLAGARFTAVDAFFAPVAIRVVEFGIRLSDESRAYAGRLLDHAAVSQWIREGVAEKAREPGHEADCLRGRKLLQDLSLS